MSSDDHEDDIRFVKRQYVQQVPIRQLKWPKSLALIQSSLWEQVFAPDLHKYPPGDRYRFLFLRDLVTKLENQEIDERILIQYTTLVQNPPAIVPPTKESILTYTLPSGKEIYISEQPSVLVSYGTTGLRTWEASLLATEWLLQQDLQRKSVLELGAGTGLAGILAAKRGAYVTATDGSNTVVTKLRENYHRNGVWAETRVLCWGEQDEILERKWDLVIGADVTYDRDVCLDLAKTYGLALRNGGVGIVAATVRNEDTLEAFVRECESQNLDITMIPGWDCMKGVFFCSSALSMRLFRIIARPVH